MRFFSLIPLFLTMLSAHASEVILSLEKINEPLPVFDARPIYETWNEKAARLEPEGSMAVTTLARPPGQPALSLKLHRQKIPREDRSIDALVSFDPRAFPPDAHRLEVRIEAPGTPLQPSETGPLEGHQYTLSATLPKSDGKVELAVALLNAKGERVAQAKAHATITPAATHPTEWNIPLEADSDLPHGLPCRVGVPLPRGLVDGVESLRLLDGEGREVPFHAEEAGRWSRHGSLRWVHLNFAASGAKGRYRLTTGSTATPEPPNGWPKEGENLSATQVAQWVAGLTGGRTDQGAALINEAFLRGGFVEHARGANYTGWQHDLLTPGERYQVPENAQWQVQASSPGYLALRCESWLERSPRERFCKIIAQLRIYPGSPFLDFDYTWIFTGDGNRDRIRNMGWDFPLASTQPGRFLLEKGESVTGERLLQYDSQKFEIASEKTLIKEGERAPGVVIAPYGEGSVAMGVRDFWQNFPSEITTGKEGLTFYLWPRNGKPRSHPTRLEDAYRLWFAHEGQVLSFSLPMEMTEGPIYHQLSGVEPPFAHGTPESVNAQGIAKTTELRFLVQPSVNDEEVAQIYRHWNERSGEPYPDPKWTASCEVFLNLHPFDPERLPAVEEGYARAAQWPIDLSETFNIYGKWIYGDIPMMADPDTGKVGLYRGYKKAHWGWPYSWIPYARSGNGSYKRRAAAATRMMADTAYCHYVSEELAAEFAKLPPRIQWAPYQPFRAKGWNNEGAIPWAGGYWGPTSRMYCDKAEFLFQSWHLAADQRSREVVADWMKQTKVEQPDRFGRGPIIATPNRGRWIDNLLRQYVLVYEETLDPWFIGAAHAIAEMQHTMTGSGEPLSLWQNGAGAYLRLTGDEAYGELFLRQTRRWYEPTHGNLWATLGAHLLPGVDAYRWSRDPWYLRRLAVYPQIVEAAQRTAAEPPEYRNWLALGDTNEAALYYGWYLQWGPSFFGYLATGEAGEPLAAPTRLSSQVRGKHSQMVPILLALPNEEVDAVVQLHLAGGQPVSVVIREERSGRELLTRSLDAGTHRLELPEAKTGTQYRLELTSVAPFSLRVPVTEETIGEMYAIEADRQLPVTRGDTFFWFQTTQNGEKEWQLRWKPLPRHPVRRASLWNAEGGRLDDVQRLNRELAPGGEIVTLKANSEKDHLLRLSLPGAHEGGEIPEGISPWYSLSRAKRFVPIQPETP